jgi:hypothetical protein
MAASLLASGGSPDQNVVRRRSGDKYPTKL